MQTSEVLNAAADLIEERGWVQIRGWFDKDDPDAPLCLEGGIQAATGLERHFYDAATFEMTKPLQGCPAYRAVADYLDDVPYYWNDECGRTAAEVIEVLRACAVIEQSRERQPVEAVV